MNDPEDFRRAAAGCIESRNRIAEQNMGLVGWVATRLFRRLQMSRDELMGIGYLKLVQIIPHFDPDVGVRFSHYAELALRRGMVEAAFTNRTISMPGDRGQYISEKNRQQRKVRAYDENHPETVFMLKSMSEPSDTQAVDESEEYQIERRRLFEMLDKLQPRHREVMIQRFIHGLTGVEVAKLFPNQRRGGRPAADGRLHVSNKRIRQLQQQAIERLNDMAKARGYEPNWSMVMPQSKKFVRNL